MREITICLLGIITVLVLGCDSKLEIETNSNALSSAPDPELQAPDFAIPDPEGDEFRLSAYEGDILVLNFWAPWCGYCRAEFPDFVALQEELEDKGVRFVGIAAKEQEWEEINPVVEEYELNFHIIKDNGNFYDKYGPMGVPRTFVINHRGEVAHIIKGPITKEKFGPMLEELIELAERDQLKASGV